MTAGIVAAFLTGDCHVLGASMDDRLHQPYRARLFPHLDAVSRAATRAGAIGACLSGAGPTVLALADRSRADAVIAAVAEAAIRTGVPGETIMLELTRAGASIGPTETIP